MGTDVMAERLTIDDVVKRSAHYLAQKGCDTPRLDAELLVGHALGMTRLQLYLDRERPLDEEELARARELLRRRAHREPVAYIIGRKEFYGREFAVTPAVLIRGSTAAEVIEDKKNGFLCSEHTDDFAQTIVKVLSDPGTLAQVAAHAQKTLCRTWEDVATEVAGRYRSILERWAR